MDAAPLVTRGKVFSAHVRAHPGALEIRKRYHECLRLCARPYRECFLKLSPLFSSIIRVSRDVRIEGGQNYLRILYNNSRIETDVGTAFFFVRYGNTSPYAVRNREDLLFFRIFCLFPSFFFFSFLFFSFIAKNVMCCFINSYFPTNESARISDARITNER